VTANAIIIPEGWAFTMDQRVTKIRGSKWTGCVVGFYSTTLTPEGYSVESENETGNVQIYPRAALKDAPDDS
jgi:dihydrofolate reductase (trimethoprim resistance protein)